ncbi:MAG: HD domain-containing protein [Lachnospiraceae bacterium]|nr:HD domain-containing protein [Lachnospiraceae bacterium]
MFEILAKHQLNIMLVLTGVCMIIGVFVLLSKGMSKKRKIALALLQFQGMLLLLCDRWAYIYRGDVSTLGYWMVRVCNFVVFAMVLSMVASVNLYLMDLLERDCKLSRLPKRIHIGFYTIDAGLGLLVLSQFTHMYYSFDENNCYQRGEWYPLCLLIPFVMLIIDLSLVIQYLKLIPRGLAWALIAFSSLPMVAAVIQFFAYGVSLVNITMIAMGILLYIFAYRDMNNTIEQVHKKEISYLREGQASMSRLFEQTTSTLINAMDEGNNHRAGHSARVAHYARELAILQGKSQEECEIAYLAGLLHDVGKAVIPEAVLAKESELNETEQKIFENHTIEGEKIVAEIKDYPMLQGAARSHHERFDGSGYPDGLKGEEIPELARIIAIADAYDDMTSYSGGKKQLPQARVREEFVKGIGTKFDPVYARLMIKMIGADSKYELRETGKEDEKVWKKELNCVNYRDAISSGIVIDRKRTIITLRVRANASDVFSTPAIIIYDSLDGMVHLTEQAMVENSYMEYGEMWFDGHTLCSQARELQCMLLDPSEVEESFEKVSESESEIASENAINADGEHATETLAEHTSKSENPMVLPTGHEEDQILEARISAYEEAWKSYTVVTERFRDHLRIRIFGGKKVMDAIVVLPDSTRYAYVAFSGENCEINNLEYEVTNIETKEGDIPRIAEEISYLNRMESDLKNVQIDGYRTAATSSLPMKDSFRIEFHTMSLPTAHLIWHTPYIVVFASDNGEVYGPNYREFTFIRLDGEVEGEDEQAENKMLVTKTDKFDSWETWNELNKKGFEVSVDCRRKGNKITIITENHGIYIKNVTTLDSSIKDVYIALTGDQVALTDIRVI